MQQQNLSALISAGFKNPFEEKAIVKSHMKALAVKNSNDLAEKNVPDYLRIPSAAELVEMRQWAIDYKKANKQASKREVRKATQSHFKIKVYR